MYQRWREGGIGPSSAVLNGAEGDRGKFHATYFTTIKHLEPCDGGNGRFLEVSPASRCSHRLLAPRPDWGLDWATAQGGTAQRLEPPPHGPHSPHGTPASEITNSRAGWSA